MVSWEYLLEKLEHRGFSTRWRDFGKAEKKLSGWQGRLLNLAGRRELVRSVLTPERYANLHADISQGTKAIAGGAR